MIQRFDHTTPQDTKRHLKADEKYVCERGMFSVDVFVQGRFNRREWAKAGESILVKAGDCHKVNGLGNKFSGFAEKTQKSTYENGGKVSGKLCEHYGNCPISESCENQRLERKKRLE